MAQLRIDVGADRERLLAVKRGEVGWPEVEAWMNRRQDAACAALGTSPLPAAPDHARVQDLLVRARRASALQGL